MLSTDLATFGAIYSTHGSLWRCQYLTCVFPRHFVAPHHPQPTTPMKSLVVLVKKLSKMAGNSASKPLNCTPNELPCITVEWWRIAWKKLCAFSRYTAFNISKRYFSIFVIARIRPLLANPVTYKPLRSYSPQGSSNLPSNHQKWHWEWIQANWRRF